MPDRSPVPYEAIAERFDAARARAAALVAQAQSWTGVKGCDDLGSFDTVAPLDGDQLQNVYARLMALSVQRLRVLSAQLSAAYATDPDSTFVYNKLLYNPGTQEVEVASQEVTALARLESEERDRLKDLLALSVRLQLEVRAADAIKTQGQRMAALAQALCERVGLDWNEPETKRLAQSAVLAAEDLVARA
ncbi:MAG TPA: hypothetical protein VE155_06530 [Pseudonocardiaceae bacterium]|jgi:hypothetical protein|nr:hypothetical protein [Pseudonocardiaceae bacterium]